MPDGSVQDMVMRQHIAGICRTTLSGTWLWAAYSWDMLGYAGRLCPGHGYETVYSWDVPDSPVWDMVMRQHIAGICPGHGWESI